MTKTKIEERVSKMTEAEVRAALIDLAEAATTDPESMVVGTEEVVATLELYGLNLYEDTTKPEEAT